MSCFLLISHLFGVSESTFVATCVVVNASVASHVFFSIDSSLIVVVNVRALSGPFSPCFCLFQLTVALPWWLTFGLCLDHLVLVVV